MFIGLCTIFFFSASTLNGWGLSYDVIVIQYCITVMHMMYHMTMCLKHLVITLSTTALTSFYVLTTMQLPA